MPAALFLSKNAVASASADAISSSNNGEYNQKQVIEKIKVLNEKVALTRESFLSGDFESSDFQAVKIKCEK